MELDDLKQHWNDSRHQYKTPAYQLNELISTNSTGSLNKLKTTYKKQVIFLPLAAAVLVATMIIKPALQQNAFFWFIIPITLLLTLMYYRDYKLVLEMELANTESIKNSIQKNIKLLQQNAKQHLLLIKVILAAFIIILEATMYYQQPTEFSFWQNVALPFRLVVYGMAGFVQPFITNYFFNLNFGQYINKLQNLLNQTD